MTYSIRGDVHTHTLFSRHAYSTIEENVRAAADAGLELLGSADHFSGMLFCEQHLRNFQYFINMGIWPRTWHGVTVLRGCEVDIVGLRGELFGQDIPVGANITGQPLLPRAHPVRTRDGGVGLQWWRACITPISPRLLACADHRDVRARA